MGDASRFLLPLPPIRPPEFIAQSMHLPRDISASFDYQVKNIIYCEDAEARQKYLQIFFLSRQSKVSSMFRRRPTTSRENFTVSTRR